MYISEQGKEQVQPNTFWIVIAGVTVIFASLGLYYIRTGEFPQLPSWIPAAIILLLWTRSLFWIVRYGRKALSLWWITFLLGYTLFAGGDLVPHLGQAKEWVKMIGALAMVCTLFPQWIVFGKRPPSTLG